MNPKMNRWEKLEWLKETTSHDFYENHLMDEMVRWMGEDDFSKFYDNLCSMWEIARTPTELQAKMEDKMDQYDCDTDTIQEEEEEEELSYTYKGVVLSA